MSQVENALVRAVYDRFLTELESEPDVDTRLVEALRGLLREELPGADLALLELYNEIASEER